MFRFTLCFFLLLCCLPTVQAANENRIWLDAKINGQPVKLIFDTGCDSLMLFRSTAERLHLDINEPPPNVKPGPGQILDGYTDVCELKLWNQTIQTRFNLVNVPAAGNSEVEGLIGWPPLRSNIIAFSIKGHRMTVLGKVPAKTESWQKFPIRKNAGFLIVEIPKSGGAGSVLIDTGSSDAVSVSSKIWQKWKADHPNDPYTLVAYYMPGTGTRVTQVMWAPRLNLGSLELHNVLIKEANLTETTIVGPGFMANLPMEALARKDMIVDGKSGFAYFSPDNNPAPKPDYNRLGAVFAPDQPEDNNLIAHVAANSPATRAGIQDGDILLKIGSRDMANWRNEPPSKTPFTELPEGTRLDLVLKRGESTYSTTAILEDILRPQNDKRKPWEKALRWIREHKPQL